MRSSEIKGYVGRVWGDLNVFVENALEIENPAVADLEEERERFSAREKQAEQIIADLVDMGQRLKAENERLLRVNEEGYQALVQALSQAKPDSIKSTVPVVILRALAGLVEQETKGATIKTSFRDENGEIVSASEMLDLCKRNDDRAKAFMDRVISAAVSLVGSNAGRADPAPSTLIARV